MSDTHAAGPADATSDKPAIESASATTSRDNSSGAAPYVIVAAVLVAIIAFGIAVTNAVVSYASIVASQYGETALEDLLGDDSGDYGDLGGGGSENDGYGYGNGGRSGMGGSLSSGKLTQDDALSYLTGDSSFLSESVNDYVYASDYQGSQAAVSTYVKSLAKIDEEGIAQAQSHLRAAASAKDDATRSSELDQAAKLCTDTKNAVGSLGLDDSALKGQSVSDIKDELKDAKDGMDERWDDIAQIVALVQAPDGHRASELTDLDSDASAKVMDIAIDLTGALTDSASSK